MLTLNGLRFTSYDVYGVILLNNKEYSSYVYNHT